MFFVIRIPMNKEEFDKRKTEFVYSFFLKNSWKKINPNSTEYMYTRYMT